MSEALVATSASPSICRKSFAIMASKASLSLRTMAASQAWAWWISRAMLLVFASGDDVVVTLQAVTFDKITPQIATSATRWMIVSDMVCSL